MGKANYPVRFNCVLEKQNANEIIDFIGDSKWWQEAELNRRHKDFQSSALPTELSCPQSFKSTEQNPSCK
jgi:hypothetical protein